MTENPDRVHDPVCPSCGPIGDPPEPEADQERCPRCGVTISISPHGRTEIHVIGQDASEVEAVSRQLSAGAFERAEARRLRSPWFSGLFYLTVLVVVAAVLLVVARTIALWALPIVVFGAAMLVSVVGAFQLRADERLSERSFLKLMGDVLRRLPAVFSRTRPVRGDEQRG